MLSLLISAQQPEPAFGDLPELRVAGGKIRLDFDARFIHRTLMRQHIGRPQMRFRIRMGSPAQAVQRFRSVAILPRQCPAEQKLAARIGRIDLQRFPRRPFRLLQSMERKVSKPDLHPSRGRLRIPRGDAPKLGEGFLGLAGIEFDL